MILLDALVAPLKEDGSSLAFGVEFWLPTAATRGRLKRAYFNDYTCYSAAILDGDISRYPSWGGKISLFFSDDKFGFRSSLSLR